MPGMQPPSDKRRKNHLQQIRFEDRKTSGGTTEKQKKEEKMIIRRFEVIVAVPENSMISFISADKICEEIRNGEVCEDCAIEVNEVNDETRRTGR